MGLALQGGRWLSLGSSGQTQGRGELISLTAGLGQRVGGGVGCASVEYGTVEVVWKPKGLGELVLYVRGVV